MSLNLTTQRIRWRNIALSGAEFNHILICSFYAPHVGTELADHVSFWIQLRASIEEVLALHPRARLILAGDSNIYLSEIMGSERERSGEPRLRELVRDLCRDFGLVIKDPPGVPTHRSGSAIDLVLASQDLNVRNLIVHDGHSCGCPSDSCYPHRGSDHKLITFQIVLPPFTPDTASPAWPRVRDWRPVVRALRPRLTDWSAKVSNFCRDGSHYSVDTRRAILDVLHAEFVHMF